MNTDDNTNDFQKDESYEPQKINVKSKTNNEDQKPIIVLSIEICQGQNELIQIYSNSIPEQLAYEFCTRNNLDYDSLQLLTQQIKDILKGNLKKKSPLTAKNSRRYSHNSNYVPTKKRNNSINTKETINHNKTSTINNTKRHRLSYLIPTQSSRSKNIKFRSITKDEEDTIYSTMALTKTKLSKPKLSVAASYDNLLNTGERLYFKGIKLKEKKEEKINIFKKQMTKSNSAIYTFKPKINTISNDTMNKRITNGMKYNDDIKILGYNKYVSRKIEILKEKHCDNSEYTFKPTISRKSEQIDKLKAKQSIPRHELLYEDYKKQQSDIELLSNQIYNKNVLFKPQINHYESQYVNIPFEERQNYFKTKQAEKQKNLREQIESPEDEITGQKFFHPEINDYDRGKSQGYNIFNSLYMEAMKTQMKKRENAESKEMERLYNSNYSHVNVDSQDIYENKKTKCFSQIFNLLDRDQDGIITKRSIDCKALPKQIVVILAPIIDELKEEDETLNEDEFITACFHLFDMLEYIEKKQLLTYTMNSSLSRPITFDSNEFTFKRKDQYQFQ